MIRCGAVDSIMKEIDSNYPPVTKACGLYAYQDPRAGQHGPIRQDCYTRIADWRQFIDPSQRSNPSSGRGSLHEPFWKGSGSALSMPCVTQKPGMIALDSGGQIG